MCGIAGIVRLDGTIGVDETRLKRMRDVIRHRGPDGEGLWIDGPVGLAHRRLSIVDVAAGQQPMSNEDDSAWIVYNGEVYNHAELRPGLEASGHRYRTRSDTKPSCTCGRTSASGAWRALQGMFAFAIWERGRMSCVLARDRLGDKPLYYMIDGEELYSVGDQGDPLRHHAGAAFNDRVLPEYLATGFPRARMTFYRGVRNSVRVTRLTGRASNGIRQRGMVAAGDGHEQHDHLPAGAEEVRERLRAAVREPSHEATCRSGSSSPAASTPASRRPHGAHGERAHRDLLGAFDDRAPNELPYARWRRARWAPSTAR